MVATPEWAPWADWLPSTLASHPGECCTVARGWFLAMSRSLWRGEGGPTWIANRYPWGPEAPGEVVSWRGVEVPLGKWVSPAHAARVRAEEVGMVQPG
jgi:hypothetical protein